MRINAAYVIVCMLISALPIIDCEPSLCQRMQMIDSKDFGRAGSDEISVCGSHETTKHSPVNDSLA
jgi:hypothetical protein